MTFHPIIPLVGLQVGQEEGKDSCRKMFALALFIKAKTWIAAKGSARGEMVTQLVQVCDRVFGNQLKIPYKELFINVGKCFRIMLSKLYVSIYLSIRMLNYVI